MNMVSEFILIFFSVLQYNQTYSCIKFFKKKIFPNNITINKFGFDYCSFLKLRNLKEDFFPKHDIYWCTVTAKIIKPGAVFTKGLSQVLGLTFVYKYSQSKSKTWLRPLGEYGLWARIHKDSYS